MADILLSNTYFCDSIRKQESNMTPYPPLATLYAASVLRDEGMDVALFDTQFVEGAEDAFPQIKAHAGKLFYDRGRRLQLSDEDVSGQYEGSLFHHDQICQRAGLYSGCFQLRCNRSYGCLP